MDKGRGEMKVKLYYQRESIGREDIKRDIYSAITELQFLHFLSSTHSVFLMVTREFGARPEKEVRL